MANPKTLEDLKRALCSKGSTPHEDHDGAVLAALTTNTYDAAMRGAQQELQETEEASLSILQAFAREQWGEQPADDGRAMSDWRVTSLACIILLYQFPATWRQLRQPALVALEDVLRVIQTTKLATVFPPLWTQKVFEVECMLAPGDVRSVIFGIDPIPNNDKKNGGAAATGVAFTFTDHFANDAISAKTLKLGTQDCKYKLTHFPLGPGDFHQYVLQPNGVALVNIIRTIPKDSCAGNRNPFRNAWAAYHKSWLRELYRLRPTLPVLIFENVIKPFPFENYSTELLPMLRCTPAAARDCSQADGRRVYVLPHPSRPDKIKSEHERAFELFLKKAKISCRCVVCLPPSVEDCLEGCFIFLVM